MKFCGVPNIVLFIFAQLCCCSFFLLLLFAALTFFFRVLQYLWTLMMKMFFFFIIKSYFMFFFLSLVAIFYMLFFVTVQFTIKNWKYVKLWTKFFFFFFFFIYFTFAYPFFIVHRFSHNKRFKFIYFSDVEKYYNNNERNCSWKKAKNETKNMTSGYWSRQRKRDWKGGINVQSSIWRLQFDMCLLPEKRFSRKLKTFSLFSSFCLVILIKGLYVFVTCQVTLLCYELHIYLNLFSRFIWFLL